MNKYKKYAIASTIPLVLGMSLATLSSCGGFSYLGVELYRNYIMEHTISLMTAGTDDEVAPIPNSSIESTAWFYKKDSGYTWYLGTNWHVEYLLKTTLQSNSNSYLWYTYETDPIHPSYKWTTDQNNPSSYQIITKDSYNLDDWKGCRLGRNNKEWLPNKIIDYGVDFAIIKIDFSDAVRKDSVFKKRLDWMSNLTFYRGDEYITFNNDIYFGGFPKTSFWDTDNVHFTMFNFNVVNVFKYQALTYNSNPIDQEAQAGWKHTFFGADGQGRGFKQSIANMYICNNFEGNSNSGSSGSICINSNFEVVGILFGSFGNGSSVVNECTGIDLLITQHTSYFSPDGYNVIDLYEKNQWLPDTN